MPDPELKNVLHIWQAPEATVLGTRLWGIAGPGAEEFADARFEKKHAQLILNLIEFKAGVLEEFNARQHDDLVNANISSIKNIHEKSLRLIARIVSESLTAHPHYENSYPKVLSTVEKAEESGK